MYTGSFFRYASILFLMLASLLLVSAQAAEPVGTPAEPLNLPAVAPVVDCAALASADLSRAAGASVQLKSAAVISDGKLAPYCKVQGQIDGFVNFEVRPPVSTWKQRLLFGGAGVLPPEKMGEFVIAAREDLGHRGNEDVFAKNYQY